MNAIIINVIIQLEKYGDIYWLHLFTLFTCLNMIAMMLMKVKVIYDHFSKRNQRDANSQQGI